MLLCDLLNDLSICTYKIYKNESINKQHDMQLNLYGRTKYHVQKSLELSVLLIYNILVVVMFKTVTFKK